MEGLALLVIVVFFAEAWSESAFMAAVCKDVQVLTYHGHPSDCNKFFVCLDAHPFVMDCPYNLHFDARHIICKAPGEVECPMGMPQHPMHHPFPPPHPHPMPPPHHFPPPSTTKKPKKTKSTTKSSSTSTTTTTTTTTTARSTELDDDEEEESAEESPMRALVQSHSKALKSSKSHQVECCHFYIGACWDC